MFIESAASNAAPLNLDFQGIAQSQRWRLDCDHGLSAAATKFPGAMEYHSLESGIVLFMADLLIPAAIECECLNLEACAGFGYCQSGSMVFGGMRFEGAPLIREGEMAVFSTPAFDSYVERLDGSRITRISISIRKSMFESFNDRYEGLLDGTEEMFGSNPSIRTYSPGPAVRQIMSEALACPLAGPLRLLYIEGKALELLVGCLGELRIGRGQPEARPQAGRKQVEQAELAARLLVDDFETVPTLEEVARKVGLSRCALSQIFQKVHGMTPFAYLRARRLDKARDMMAEGAMNVTEAAMAVGYSSVSHFTKAFTSRFDIHPSDCRKARRGFAQVSAGQIPIAPAPVATGANGLGRSTP